MPDEQLAALGRLRTLVSDLNFFLSLAGSGSENPAFNSIVPVPTRSWHHRGPTTRSQAWKAKRTQRARPEPTMASQPHTWKKSGPEAITTRPEPPAPPVAQILNPRPEPVPNTPDAIDSGALSPKQLDPTDSGELGPADFRELDRVSDSPHRELDDCEELNPATCEDVKTKYNTNDSMLESAWEQSDAASDSPPSVNKQAVLPRSGEYKQSARPSAYSPEGSVCRQSPPVTRECSPSLSPQSSLCPVRSIRQASPDPSHARYTRSWFHYPAHSVRRSSPAHRPWPAHSRRTSLSPNRSAGCSSVHHSLCQPHRSHAEPLNLSPTHCPTQHSAWSPIQHSFNRRSYSQSPYDSVHSGGLGESTGQVGCRDEVGHSYDTNNAYDSYDTNNAHCDDGGGFGYDDGGGGSYDDYGGDGYDDGYGDYEDY